MSDIIESSLAQNPDFSRQLSSFMNENVDTEKLKILMWNLRSGVNFKRTLTSKINNQKRHSVKAKGLFAICSPIWDNWAEEYIKPKLAR